MISSYELAQCAFLLVIHFMFSEGIAVAATTDRIGIPLPMGKPFSFASSLAGHVFCISIFILYNAKSRGPSFKLAYFRRGLRVLSG